MISYFLRTKKKFGATLIRFDVDEVTGKDSLGKITPFHGLMFYACAVYDHPAKKWLKNNIDSANLETGLNLETSVPDHVRSIDHVFFSTLGLVWHIVADERFHLDFRSLCAKYCVVNIVNRIEDCVERTALVEFLKNGCKDSALNESSAAYKFYPL